MGTGLGAAPDTNPALALGVGSRSTITGTHTAAEMSSDTMLCPVAGAREASRTTVSP